MSNEERRPGWDAKAIQAIVAEHYSGGLAELFETHGWPERGRSMMPTQQGHIAQTYGSIDGFVRAHEHGVDGNAILDPMAAINSDPPDVWLTSEYGFDPENWGCLGFTEERMRDRFLRESRPGALVVIYGTGRVSPAERNRVLGVQQQSHLVGEKWAFLSAEQAEREWADPNHEARWLHAVRTIKAWCVPPERRPLVGEFAPDTYSPQKARSIGSMGIRLSASEARRVLELDLFEVQVFGGGPVESPCALPGRQALTPSRPGPVSQTAYLVREAEGPKHLYVLQLQGNAEHFLGRDPGDRKIVKVGFSVSPETRRDAHQRALPDGAFKWRIHRSTYEEGHEAFPSSRHALAGEQTMIEKLKHGGDPLGGEFFLASDDTIDLAWRAAIAAAESGTK